MAVSLRDVAAGAALNEDYASLVSAAETLLRGDPSLDFLIIVRNDGFSIINEQKSWRVETISDSFLLPETRDTFGSIRNVPLLNRRVFSLCAALRLLGNPVGMDPCGAFAGRV